MRKTYRDLFIDFDDALYDTRGNSTAALCEVFELFRLAPHFPDRQAFIDNFWHTNTELWSQYAVGHISRDHLMLQRFLQPLSLGVNLTVTETLCRQMSDKILELGACKSGLVNGARELMDYLKSKGYGLHICSNGFRQVQYKKLSACGLLPYFDNIILSDEVGAQKPSPDFFAAALRATGADAQATLMIGDNYQTDIEGAMNAGLDTMLFNRWDKHFVPPRPATFVVARLSDIMKIL